MHHSVATHSFSGVVAAALSIAILCCASAAFAAAPKSGAAPAAAILDVTGVDGKRMTVDVAALGKLPQHTVHAQAHGKSVTCTGPTLIDVVDPAGKAGGEKLRGKNLALHVRASAADGYHAVFSFAEIDSGIGGDDVPIVTASCDGRALDAKDGPLRIVAPRDKRPARWVRQLTALEVLGGS